MKGDDDMKRELLKNKLVALGLIGAGLLPVLFFGDATFLVFALPVGLALFFAKRNYID